MPLTSRSVGRGVPAADGGNGRPQRISVTAVAILTTTLVLALGARIFQLDTEALHVDEIRQVQEVQRPLGDIVELSYRHLQPPLDYLIGKAVVEVFPATDFVQRLPAAMAGGLAVVIVVWMLLRLGMPYAAFVTGVVASTHPTLIQYSQYARPYALPLFTVAAALLVYQQWELAGGGRLWAASFFLATSLALLARALMPLIALGTLGVILLARELRRQRQPTNRQMRSALTPLMVLLGGFAFLWLPNFLFGLRRFGSHYLFVGQYDMADRLRTAIQNISLHGQRVARPLPLFVILASAVLLIFLPTVRSYLRVTWYIWIPILVTAPLFAFAHALTTPPGQFFADRYMYFFPMGLILLLAILAEGVAVVLKSSGRAIRIGGVLLLTTVFAAFLVAPTVRATVDLYRVRTVPDWKAVAEHIEATERSGDVIVAIDVRPFRVGAFNFGFMSAPRYYSGNLAHLRPDDVALDGDSPANSAARYHFVLFAPKLSADASLPNDWQTAAFTRMLVVTSPALHDSAARLEAWWTVSEYLRPDSSIMARLAGFALAKRNGYDTAPWLESIMRHSSDLGLTDLANNWLDRIDTSPK